VEPNGLKGCAELGLRVAVPKELPLALKVVRWLRKLTLLLTLAEKPLAESATLVVRLRILLLSRRCVCCVLLTASWWACLPARMESREGDGGEWSVLEEEEGW
jgi:hypothetical protein